jgi:hypothetical protein
MSARPKCPACPHLLRSDGTGGWVCSAPGGCGDEWDVETLNLPEWSAIPDPDDRRQTLYWRAKTRAGNTVGSVASRDGRWHANGFRRGQRTPLGATFPTRAAACAAVERWNYQSD